MNKRGAEMTIGTIIVIILAIVVLVVLIYGFTSGWGNLWDRLTGFGGGKVNVQSVVDSCKVACTTSASYDYCEKIRSVVSDEKKPAESKKCIQLQGQYGLEPCTNVDCSGSNMNNPGKPCNNVPTWTGQWISGRICDIKTQKDITKEQILLSSEKNDPAHVNQYCCVDLMTACPATPAGSWVTSSSTCATGTYDVTFLLTAAAKTGHESDKCCIQ